MWRTSSRFRHWWDSLVHLDAFIWKDATCIRIHMWVGLFFWDSLLCGCVKRAHITQNAGDHKFITRFVLLFVDPQLFLPCKRFAALATAKWRCSKMRREPMAIEIALPFEPFIAVCTHESAQILMDTFNMPL